MKQLDSPRVVKMLDWNRYGRLFTLDNELHNNDSFPYLILELAHHKELYDYLQVSPLPENIARYYFAQILDALEYLHNKNIAHCDIKLRNILLDKDYRLKLADFGFASDESSEGFGSVGGTLSYMAPELLKGTRGNVVERNKRVDVYTAGIVLFNMVTACAPYSIAKRRDKLFKKFVEDNEKFWSHHEKHSFKGKLDNDLKELLNGMLNPNPELRWSLVQIKRSNWLCKGDTASAKEVVKEMSLRQSYMETAGKSPHKKHIKRLRKKSVKREETSGSYQRMGMFLWNIYIGPVSYTHLRAHETGRNLVCRLLLEKKKKKKKKKNKKKKKKEKKNN
eukprot:TRINITY_DN5453_c0_g1_i11.p1 TRINITY_DN5453_c0_g1~~TRINITY_DN5453_c0_g1_i11.p1  ORF type:complete len:335 (-),score=92.55 TRINITY_DN5453_c0_g1_i11:6-1010(-)